MRFIFLSLVCVVFFALVEAGLPFGLWKFKNASYRERVSDIKRRLRDRNITVNEVVNDTNVDLEDVEDDDTLFDVAADEFNVTVRNTTDKNKRRGFFVKNLGNIQNMTRKHKNAYFGVNKFSFMSEDEFKKVRNYRFILFDIQ